MIDDTHNERHAFTLRAIAHRVGAPSLKDIVRQPAVRAAYQVIVYHWDRRALDVVATVRRAGAEEATLTLVYDGLPHLRPIRHALSLERYNGFVLALSRLHFDKLKDQPRMPGYGTDLWMIERAAGTFLKSVIVAPEVAQGDHARLAGVIRTYLPEVLREIT
jgi:hypothetical protein